MDSPEKRLRKLIQEHSKGGCKMLSLGEECNCPLCDLDKITRALWWYGEEAKAITKNFKEGKESALVASVRVLSLDGGKRAEGILGKVDNSEGETIL